MNHTIDMTVVLRHPRNQPLALLPDLANGVVDLTKLDQEGCGSVDDFPLGPIVGLLRVEKTASGSVFYLFITDDEIALDTVGLVAATRAISREQAQKWLRARVKPDGLLPTVADIADGEQYLVIDGQIKRCTKHRNRKTGAQETKVVPLTNFTAYIVEVITFSSAQQRGTPSHYVIVGYDRKGQPLDPPQITVSVDDFLQGLWPEKSWPTQAIVMAGQGIRTHAMVAIQLLSQKHRVKRSKKYDQFGWHRHSGEGWIYVTAGAVIGENGDVTGVDVQLRAQRMGQYALPSTSAIEPEILQRAIKCSITLIDDILEQYSIPYLAAVYRAPLGHFDAVVWPTGETGRQKTALLAIIMMHFGPDWHERSFVLSWLSSVKAIEELASYLRDVLIPLEDFKPRSEALGRANADLSHMLQAVGDGSGRHTLTADRQLREMPEICGCVVSTSETYPAHHSDVARTIIVEVGQKIAHNGTASGAMYAAADAGREGILCLAMAGYIRYLAARHDRVYGQCRLRLDFIRDYERFFRGAHSRTGVSIADLAYGWYIFLHYAVASGAFSGAQAQQYWERVCRVFSDLAAAQGAGQADENPVTQFLRLIQALLSQRRIHLDQLPGSELMPSELSVAQKTSVMVGWCSVRKDGQVWIHFLQDAIYG
ncbi:hypothetical protein WDJ50_06845 [Deinococcus sp. VB142]|uniref:DUF927 domain-containing protein n=1 Tax=Deinococcus sp. VB142 TaxID=3112952 RepID=A0AAU6Q5K9_9DEIO